MGREERADEAYHRTHRHHGDALADDKPLHAALVGAERDANPDFARSSSDAERDDPVDANRGERQCDRREEPEKGCYESLGRGGHGGSRGQELHVIHRILRRDIVENATDVLAQNIRIARGPNEDVHAIGRPLMVRQVQGRSRQGIRPLPNVADDADHLEPTRPESGSFPDRILVRPERAGGRFTDHGDFGRRGVVGRREQPTTFERNARGGEEFGRGQQDRCDRHLGSGISPIFDVDGGAFAPTAEWRAIRKSNTGHSRQGPKPRDDFGVEAGKRVARQAPGRDR